MKCVKGDATTKRLRPLLDGLVVRRRRWDNLTGGVIVKQVNDRVEVIDTLDVGEGESDQHHVLPVEHNLT